MSMMSIRRPLVLFLLPWLLALFDGLSFFGTADTSPAQPAAQTDGEPSPGSGPSLDPWG